MSFRNLKRRIHQLHPEGFPVDLQSVAVTGSISLLRHKMNRPGLFHWLLCHYERIAGEWSGILLPPSSFWPCTVQIVLVALLVSNSANEVLSSARSTEKCTACRL